MVLVLVMLISILQGVSASSDAVSAIHQIYSVLWYLIATVCLVGVGIIHTLESLLEKQGVSENSQAETAKAS
jgi:hypothetical protein